MGENMLAGETLRIELEDHYEKLINTIQTSPKYNKELAGFSPRVGSNFDSSSSRLLVCGRAVNGWRKLDLTKNETEIYKCICSIDPKDRAKGCEMNWIQRSRENYLKHEEEYNYKNSSFWSGTRDVLTALEEHSELSKNNWPSLLAWSNIYKISHNDGGNPGHKLRGAQIPQCKLILNKEIEMLRPKNILFITGDWGEDILKSLNVEFIYKSKKAVLFEGKINMQCGNNNSLINVVVASRPEGKKRTLWVKEVVSAFKGMNG